MLGVGLGEWAAVRAQHHGVRAERRARGVLVLPWLILGRTRERARVVLTAVGRAVDRAATPQQGGAC